MAPTMVTCQVWRLEFEDHGNNHYKQYTGILAPGQAIFGYSRIGSTWQWSTKPGGDFAGAVRSQLNAKRSKGYEDVWNGDITVPSTWLEDPKRFGRQFQDLIESAYRDGAYSASAGTPVSSDSDSPPSVLQPVLDECRSLLSKMAANPDSAIKDYPALVGSYEEVKNQMDVVDGYMDTLRLMLAGQEASA